MNPLAILTVISDLREQVAALQEQVKAKDEQIAALERIAAKSPTD